MIVVLKCSETALGLKEGVGLSTGRLLFIKTFSHHFISPMYCLLQPWQCTMYMRVLELQLI